MNLGNWLVGQLLEGKNLACLRAVLPLKIGNRLGNPVQRSLRTGSPQPAVG